MRFSRGAGYGCLVKRVEGMDLINDPGGGSSSEAKKINSALSAPTKKASKKFWILAVGQEGGDTSNS